MNLPEQMYAAYPPGVLWPPTAFDYSWAMIDTSPCVSPVTHGSLDEKLAEGWEPYREVVVGHNAIVFLRRPKMPTAALRPPLQPDSHVGPKS